PLRCPTFQRDTHARMFTFGPMNFEITPRSGYLRATLSGRDTVDEMRSFMRALARECRAHDCSAVLIDVRASRPVFHVEPRGVFEDFKKLSCRIALLGDTPELRLSNEYLALLARQQGLNVESYRFEVTAIRSLTDRREAQERRHSPERRQQAQER